MTKTDLGIWRVAEEPDEPEQDIQSNDSSRATRRVDTGRSQRTTTYIDAAQIVKLFEEIRARARDETTRQYV